MFKKNHISIVCVLSITVFLSCKNEISNTTFRNKKNNKIVLITTNAPAEYSHLIDQDSLGEILKNSLRGKSYFTNNGFTFLNHMNNEETWLPKPMVNDTLEIACYTDYLELTTHNFFTSIKDSFLVQNGDTVIFNYTHGIPKASIKNRTVNDIELNYNHHRLYTLFDNKYNSHFMVFGHLFLYRDFENAEQNTITYYQKAEKDYDREINFLDSLYNAKQLSQVNYHYRKDALNMLMEKHKKFWVIKNWLKQSNERYDKETLPQQFGFELAQTDSLIQFSFFRDYLKNISEYDLTLITENNGNSGGSYLDARIRFDSILNDNRFNQTAKNYLLFYAYLGIDENFNSLDKKRYFKKLQENTTNTEQLNKLIKDYKLDFSKTNQLILTTRANDTLNLETVLKNNKGKWLYIDFWASWCKPCRISMPKSVELKKTLKKHNIEFIYLGLNDVKGNWKEAIETDGISDSQHYFIENGNVSQIIDDLGIKTLPHYLIYNPTGKLVHGNAKRPGEGAKEDLMELIKNEK